MLKGIAFRLGFILLMAVTIRIGAALFGPSYSDPKTVAITDRSGNSYSVPAHLAFANQGGESVTSEEMRAAIARVRSRKGSSDGSEARLVFGSGTGNPVVVTPSELAAARSELRQFEGRIDAQVERMARESESERPDPNPGVSFEPGKPMIDPTPRS